MNNSEVFEQIFDMLQAHKIIGCWANDDGKYCAITTSKVYTLMYIFFKFRLDENDYVKMCASTFIQRLALREIV